MIKDLTARLPYGVMCNIQTRFVFEDGTLRRGSYDKILDLDTVTTINEWKETGELEKLKPYLRPMSGMTEDEKLHIVDLEFMIERRDNFYIAYYDFLNSIHIDYRGLISKGLAIKAPEKMYKEYRLPPLGSNWWEMYNSINLKNE